MDYAFEPVPAQEAVDFIRRKAPMKLKQFQELLPELQALSFTVGGINAADALQDLRDTVATLPEGTLWKKVQKEVTKKLDAYLPIDEEESATERSKRLRKRAQGLLRYHGNQAYAIQAYKDMDENRDIYPYWKYLTVGDEGVRDTHSALNGIILPHDHEFWNGHYPPWEFGCRCQLVPVTKGEYERTREADKLRNMEERQTLDEKQLKMLTNERALVRNIKGQAVKVDLRSPMERSDKTPYVFNPAAGFKPNLKELEQRYDKETWGAFKKFAKGTELPEGRGNLWNWLTRSAGKGLKKGAGVVVSRKTFGAPVPLTPREEKELEAQRLRPLRQPDPEDGRSGGGGFMEHKAEIRRRAEAALAKLSESEQRQLAELEYQKLGMKEPRHEFERKWRSYARWHQEAIVEREMAAERDRGRAPVHVPPPEMDSIEAASAGVKIDAPTLKALNKALPGVQAEDIAALACAPKGGTVKLTKAASGFMLEHDTTERTTERLLQIGGGKKSIYNSIFEMHRTGTGAGAQAFYDQVQAASRLGFSHIDVYAAGSSISKYNGYYTWPRLGYDGPLSSRLADQAKAEIGQEVKTVQELLDLPGGPAWWKANGHGLELKFDLTPGSLSMRKLDAYMEYSRKKRAEGGTAAAITNNITEDMIMNSNSNIEGEPGKQHEEMDLSPEEDAELDEFQREWAEVERRRKEKEGNEAAGE
jgi:SPP1 gp7 family putative phage head morphogenesis protein